MSGIKTGNKGFVNPLDGKVYTVDPVLKGEDGINDPSKAKLYDPGNMTVDKTVKDLGKLTKTTLANYLSKATLGQAGASTTANAYPIDPPSESQQESSLLTEKGYPSPLTPASSGNSKKFTTDIPSSISNNYAKGTNTAGQGADAITTLLSKGKSEESTTRQLLDGNELLRGVTKVQNVVTLPAPLGAYFSAAITPNYRTATATGKFFSESDILNPPKAFNPALLNYTKISFAPDPGSTTVASSNLSLRLDKVSPADEGITTIFNFASGLTGKNFFPVLANGNLGTNLADLKSITVNGVPPTPATAESQNTKVFASGLRNSYTDDYTELQVNTAGGLQKGKTELSIDSKDPKPSGNSFLSKIVIEGTSIKAGTGLDFLKTYTNSAISPNYRNTAEQFTTEDILSPSRKFDYKLIDYSSLQKVEPKTEAVKSSDLKLTLSSVFNFASKLTNPAAGFISLTTSVKNSYPVSAPDKFSADSLYPITTDGFPSPRNVGTNKNTFVFNDNLPSSYSAEFDSVSDQFKKGKQNTSGIDGHALLSKSIIKNAFGYTQLNLSLRNYFKNVAVVNFFYPDISNSVLSKDSNEKAFLSKQVDISSPPRTFEPIINIGTSFGKYSGKESLKTQLSLFDQRKKASEVTQINQYSVGAPVGGAFDFLSSTNSPVDSLPTPLYQNNKDSYVSRDDIKPLSRDATIKNFSKGKESLNNDNVTTGHTLLKDGVPGNYDALTGLPSNESPTGIEQFSPLYEYVGNRGAAVLNVGANRFLEPARLRSGRPARGFSTNLFLPDGRVVDQLQMAKVGVGLLQSAAGEIPAITADKFDPTGPIAAGATILPGTAQAAISKVNNLFLEANDVLNRLENGSLDVNSLTSTSGLFDDGQEYGQSWGTLTTPDEPFDDPSSIGLSILMFLLILAIIVLFGLFGTKTPESDKFADKIRPTRDNLGRLALGKYQFFNPNESTPLGGVATIENTLGIKPTKNPFSVALGAGTRAFFVGASNMDLSAGQIAAAIGGIGLDALIGEGAAVGANLVVARTIVRSGIVMAQFIDKVIKAGSQNPVSGIKAGLGILRAFRSSKIVSALNVFSQLGDALLDRQGSMRLGADGTPEPGGGMDAQPKDTFHSTVRKSRLSVQNPDGSVTYDPELAWSSRRAPSLYLVPKNVLTWQQYANTTAQGEKLGAFSGIMGLKGVNGVKSMSYNSVAQNNRRIDNKLRKDLETRLDAEYVPFYFHDVRTNEIISFHAFLTSLTDDYSANYDSVDGFGRVEPVKIYKGTQRKISFSFIIAAISEDDFHEMWFKINKLTTLAYPQYTSGRSLVGKNGEADYEFKAPFSQLIGASPLIRLRLGDLFRSNYSKFALARLFGAADSTSKFPAMSSENSGDKSTTIDEVAKFDPDVFNKDVDAVMADFKNPTPETAKKFVGVNAYPYQEWPDFFRTNNIYSPSQLKVYRIEGFDDNLKKYKVKLSPNTNSNLNLNISTIPENDVYLISPNDLIIPRDELERTKLVKSTQEIQGDPGYKFFAAVEEFLNENQNIIVRSFESAAGKGLAGVIESMNFDWYSQTTWEIAPGYTAPKMCKVTVSFSPIHDITPGIDHMGYNRAPIYPVGNAMNTVKPRSGG